MNKPLLIKLGGAIFQQPQSLKNVMLQIKQLIENQPVVVVHGGGVLVDNMLSAMGLSSLKMDGIRVTPESHILPVAAALGGQANGLLCAAAKANGLSPVGLNLSDGDTLACHKLGDKWGQVGEAKPNDIGLVESLFNQGKLPIFSSIGISSEGELLNVNADVAAAALAQLLSAKMLLVSDVKGVLDEQNNLISHLNNDSILKLINEGVIRDGMVAKVNAALQAAQCLREQVHICGWGDTQQIIDISQNKAVGTQISF